MIGHLPLYTNSEDAKMMLDGGTQMGVELSATLNQPVFNKNCTLYDTPLRS